jgi:cell division septal protein FtsQ
MKAKKRRQFKAANPGTVLIVRQIIIGVMIASFLGLLLTTVWYGTRIDSFTITDVVVSGGETISHKQVEDIARQKLNGSYIKFIPHAFAFLYPHEGIVEAIREIKRIKNLSVVRTSGSKLTIKFDEYMPHALWCKESASEGCFFLDENGYSFSPAPSLSGGSFLRFVSIAMDPQEHTQAFEVDQYKKVHELVALFAQAGWYISKAEVDGAGDVFFSIVDGGEFKVSLKQSAQETMANMLTVLNSEKFSHIKPGNFEYVDLRFGSKVFVNEVTLATATTTTSDSQGVTTTSTPESPTPVLPASNTTTTSPGAAAGTDSVEIEIN